MYKGSRNNEILISKMAKLHIKINNSSCPFLFEQSLVLGVTEGNMRRHDILEFVLKKIKL